MRTCKIMLTAVLAGVMGTACLRAQVTNLPTTRLEAFEEQVDTLVVKGNSVIGTVPGLESEVITVRARESKVAGGSVREYGVIIDIKLGGSAQQLIIDYDELDSFINAAIYLSRIDFSATALPTFDAVYTTRCGLQIGAFSSSKRPGIIQPVLRPVAGSAQRILLSTAAMAQLGTLVQNAKNTLAPLHDAK
jgi:hypothetical protein